MYNSLSLLHTLRGELVNSGIKKRPPILLLMAVREGSGNPKYSCQGGKMVTISLLPHNPPPSLSLSKFFSKTPTVKQPITTQASPSHSFNSKGTNMGRSSEQQLNPF